MAANDRDPVERETEERYISPAIQKAGWEVMTDYRLQAKITDGRYITQGKMVFRGKAWYADYLLFEREDYPIAVVESKRYDEKAITGLQQAIDYAVMTGASFAYSTNGKEFVERDLLTGLETEHIPMDKFPTKDQLIKRLHDFRNLSPEAEKIIKQPYHYGMNSYTPRYYQRQSINKAIEAVAKGMKKMLIVMATGTGKTFTAFQIIYRLREAKVANKVLFLTDRNALIDQTMDDDFAPFGNDMVKVQHSEPDPNHSIYLSLYGQWIDYKEGAKQPYESFPHDYFDLIVVDECHRGSARDDSEWRKILSYFDSAIQIGMTATPKSTEGADNIAYFCAENGGEPIYKYSLKEGINDGFLAPYRITKSFINIDLSGYVPEPDELDILGLPLAEDYYSRKDFGKKITISDRRQIVAHRITQTLKEIGRMTKTIVFCQGEDEAELMRTALIKENQDMVKKYPDYVCRITSKERHAKTYLDKFKRVKSKTPVIATTSDLLITGVNCKTCGLIVIDKEIQSMTTFKQMIGRGTRIYEPMGKHVFDILDFRNVTQLFHDKDFDGDADTTKVYKHKKGTDVPPPPPPEPENPKQDVKGNQDIFITHEIEEQLGIDGKIMSVQSLRAQFKETMTKTFKTIDIFRGKWASTNRHKVIREELGDESYILDLVRSKMPEYSDCDDFDIICGLAFGAKPLTRKERIENVKKRDFFSKYKDTAKDVLEKLLEKYADNGVLEIEESRILELSPFDAIGTKPKIMKIFGGKAAYEKAVCDLVKDLYYEQLANVN